MNGTISRRAFEWFMLIWAYIQLGIVIQPLIPIGTDPLFWLLWISGGLNIWFGIRAVENWWNRREPRPPTAPPTT